MKVTVDAFRPIYPRPAALITSVSPDGVPNVITLGEVYNLSLRHPTVVPLLEQLYAAGKAVYGMKTLGVGRLAGDARAAIQYVLQLGSVHALAIGISQQAHLRQNVRLVEELAPWYPLH